MMRQETRDDRKRDFHRKRIAETVPIELYLGAVRRAALCVGGMSPVGQTR